MGKKNKARNAQKKRQKSALKDARRRAAQKPKPQGSKKPTVTEEMFPEEDLVFWLAHGVNYLVSDYENATWTPMFEEIYEGAKLTPEDIAKAIVDKFGESYEKWPPEGEAALAWSVQPRETVYIYFLEILRRLREKKYSREQSGKLAVSPHNGVVWGVFRMVEKEMSERRKKREGKA